MKTTIEVVLMPFKIPDYVVPAKAPGLRQEGFTSKGNLPLHAISKETLVALCEEFTDAVLKKAGY